MEIHERLKESIAKIIKDEFGIDIEISLEIPDEKFGDLSTNVAMQLAPKLGKNPREIADTITQKLSDTGVKTDTLGPGFINIWFSDDDLANVVNKIQEQADRYGYNKLYDTKVVVCEYSDMNAFKTAHAGHLYTTLVGNAIANLFVVAGAKVHRANFGGDVGLHVGRAMWSIMRTINYDPSRLADIPKNKRSSWIAEQYKLGNDAYETNETFKNEIIAINKQVYQIITDNDRDSDLAKVYWTCRQWSYDGFDAFYQELDLDKQQDGSYFDYFPESETAPFGKQMVSQGQAKGVFTQSNGAVIYEGERDGLHTRVFLTSEGLPTYETKDLGLSIQKWERYHFDLNVIITANEINEYMKVVLAALNHFYPQITERTRHLTHGLVKLEGGEKMSSRKGTVVLPDEVIASATEATQANSGKVDRDVVMAAIKYSFLKQRIGGDIIYDAKESVSTVGNSGPYLQYAYARARSILAKATSQRSSSYRIDISERSIAKKLAEYPNVINQAIKDLMPHHVCNYLYELATTFNSFYEQNRVIGDDREADRLMLVNAYSQVLRNGLKILGIKAPDRM